jgi:hypothetical protein
MSATQIKRNDTKSRYWALKKNAGKAAIALTLATEVRFLMKPQAGGSGPTVNAKLTIVNVNTGEVRWDPLPGHVAVAGLYDAEFQITWQDGRTETVPSDGYEVVQIRADLGG